MIKNIISVFGDQKMMKFSDFEKDQKKVNQASLAFIALLEIWKAYFVNELNSKEKWSYSRLISIRLELEDLIVKVA